MARGGYRPGAGRKKGVKDSKPRKSSKGQEETEKIKEMLSFGIKAKAKFYHEYLIRLSKGEKLSVTEKNMMEKIGVELAAQIQEEKPIEFGTSSDPLTYMLQVMNDPNESKEMRARMAIAAAPYLHPRKGEGSKKEEREGKAKAASSGKFAPSKPPLSVVK